MPRSFRIEPDLERRLCAVAEREGVSVSAVVREAIERYCDTELAKPTLLEEMADYIGAFEGTGEDVSTRTGEAFKELLLEKYRRDIARCESAQPDAR
jgi:predicted DNA-binding protein